MDASTPVINPSPASPQVASPLEKLKTKFRGLSKTQKIIALIAGLLVLGLIFWLIFFRSSTGGPQTTIAKVGDTSIPQLYLDVELKYYPATPSSEAKKMLVQKIINDEVTLEAAKQEGLIGDYPQGSNLSNEEYLKRTALVKQVKDQINNTGYVIKGKLVMVWFYNNRIVGPEGFEASKKIAYDTIKPLYDQVKAKQITIDKAGEIIKANKSLAEIDPAYLSNAIGNFTFYKGGTATFWDEFNDKLWNTPAGEVTDLYIGGGAYRDGKPSEEAYMFAQIDEKSSSPDYIDYEKWLENKKKAYKVIQVSLPAFNLLFNPKTVFAQDDNTGRSGVWKGHVLTETGAGIIGASVYISNGCTGSPGMHLVTDSNSYFDSGTSYDLSCICDPQTIYAVVPGRECERFSGIKVVNGIASNYQDITCRLPPPPPTPTPTPTPTPPPACNVACTSNDYCLQAPDGCNTCMGGTCQKCEPKPAETRTLSCPPGQTGSITETRTYACPAGSWSEWTATSNTCTPPPACGDSCTSDSYCFGAPDGCTSCIPNNSGTGKVCAPPPACGSSCVRDDQCIGDAARNGCTACVSGTCRIPPACGTACTTKADCSGAKDNCSECLEGTCSDYNANMCKCDGIVADMSFPSNAFKFEAFGKVEGGDVKKAEIADITFRMTKNNQVIAKSNPITPEVVENSGSKLRFKAAWQTTPPAVDKNATYRLFADVRCKPKRITASNGELASIPQSEPVFESAQQLPPPPGLQMIANVINYLFGKGSDLITKEALAQFSSSPTPNQAESNLQLKTLNFVKMLDTDNCRFVMWKYDETLF